MGRIKLEAHYDAVQGGRNYMEDVVNVQLCNATDSYGYAYFGVFDGHGGAEAAMFADEHLRREIDRQEAFWSDNDECVIDAIKSGFVSTHKLMMTAVDSWPLTATGLTSTAGTTASVVIIRNNKMYVGHVGDSAVVIGKQFQKHFKDRLVAHCVTVDHKPDNVAERERIERCGGEVTVKAGISRVVWKRPRDSLRYRRRSITSTESIPFLAIARSLGDLWSYNRESDSFIVSPEPDVSVHELDCTIHRCVIVASDGVWNMVSPSDAVEFVEAWLRRRRKLIALGKDTSCLKQPAAGLVRLALDRWQIRGMRADNISAIVILLDSEENLTPPTVPVAAKVRDAYQSKCIIRRVRLGCQHRRGLRTVLGKICRLRAQRNLLGGVCNIRSPLGACNRLCTVQQFRGAATRPVMNTEASLRLPIRRRSYQEACTEADDTEGSTVERRQLRVLVRRLSVEIGRTYVDKSVAINDESSEADMSSNADNACEMSVIRSARSDFGEREVQSGDTSWPKPLVGTSAMAEMEDDSWDSPDWDSSIDLCSPVAAVDQSLPRDVPCVSA